MSSLAPVSHVLARVARVVVIDVFASGGGPSPAALATAAVAKGVGSQVVGPFHASPAEVGGVIGTVGPDAVLVAIGPGRLPLGERVAGPQLRKGNLGRRRLASWHPDAWELPIRVVRGAMQSRSEVIAVGVEVSPVVLAGCAMAGAQSVLLDDLASFLEQHQAREAPSWFDPGLAELTSTERHVLFHLTRGLTASEIALVKEVSLTTVRSHIRSILRKLGVTSQLAAVAIANGLASSGEIHGEAAASPRFAAEPRIGVGPRLVRV